MTYKQITLVVLTLLCTIGLHGQGVLDTLYGNETKNVALFFPKPIARAVTGHEGFAFSYDREKAGYFGLLQGVEGPDSNLLVITKDGLVYAFILSYAKKITNLNHFVQEVQNIGSERPLKANVPLNKTSQKDSILTGAMVQMLMNTSSKTLARKGKQGLVFRWEAMEYFRNEVYLVCGLKNRSGIDFDIGFMEVLLAHGSKKRRASYQEVPIEIQQIIGLPKSLAHGEEIRFVVVLPKFVPGDNERVKLRIREVHGNRILEIDK